MKKDTLILIAILLFFLTTRLYKINEIPHSLYWDEASIGYNAYSILQTGKDEWGVSFPIHFKAFGEYKLPLYIYSTILPVKIFGLNGLSVRLPAVIFSLFSIIITYLIAKRISNNNLVSLLSAFFLSITPYFFIFSRTGYEADAGLTFYLLGILLFLISRQKPVVFILSGMSFLMSIYSYNGYRVLSPLVLGILTFILFRYSNLQVQGKIIIMFLTLTIFILGNYPVIKFLSSEGSISRYQAIGIENLERKKVFLTLDVVKNYLSHFNPDYLFLNGDKNSRSQQPGFGQLFIYDLPFLFLGLLYLWRQPGRSKWPVAFVLLGFLPASITREAPHGLRSLSVAPFLCIISAFGVKFLQEKYIASKRIILYLVLVAYIGSFVVYFNNFIKVYSISSAKDWQEGYKLIFQDYKKQFKAYDHVLISDRYSQPYIFALSYLAFNPDDFRSTVIYNTDLKKATSVVKSFDKFIFTNVDYYQLPTGKTLIFTHPTDKLNELVVQNVIYHSDGSVAFYVYDYRN